MTKARVLFTGMLLMLGLGAATTAYAAGPSDTQTTTQQAVTQSDRWEGSGDTWRIKSADGSGYLTNSWYQDLDGSWYMLGSDTQMYAGLITDASTGKSYLLNTNHDGHYGKMLTTDGAYNVNGAQIYLAFDQSHNGTFGAIQNGLSEARRTGVHETTLASIPTDSTAGQAQAPKHSWEGKKLGEMTPEERDQMFEYTRPSWYGKSLDEMTDEEVEQAIMDTQGGIEVAHPDHIDMEAAHELSQIMNH